MDIPNVSEPKRLLLDHLVAGLAHIPGMVAVVLGGSYASGEQHAASDLDIGLYYWESAPFSIDAVKHIAREISVEGQATVTGFYGWGPWVNGGAWIHTAHGKVDFVYRNLDQVRRTIAEAQNGIVHHDYDQQPTHGFYSVIYLAETQICIPLHDPEGVIADLKRQVALYPPRLRERVIADSLWAAEFSLLFARDYAARGDVYNTVGCMARIAAALTQALFALNERYFIRDKRVMETIAAFPIAPSGYVQQVSAALSCPGDTAAALSASVGRLQAAWQSVVDLTAGVYEPKFRL